MLVEGESDEETCLLYDSSHLVLMHSRIVTVLCLRVIDPRVCNGLDLPALESLLMGFNALSFTPTTDSALIMRSNEANVN